MSQVNGLEAVAGVQGRIGMLHAFQQVIRREGFKALWKGNGVTIVHRLPYSAVNFWAYEQATQLWLQVWDSYLCHQAAPCKLALVLHRLLESSSIIPCACIGSAYNIEILR